jgi:hypothetical protein
MNVSSDFPWLAAMGTMETIAVVSPMSAANGEAVVRTLS